MQSRRNSLEGEIVDFLMLWLVKIVNSRICYDGSVGMFLQASCAFCCL